MAERKGIRVCRVEELPPGERKIIDAGKTSIGVFNLDGNYYALRNTCPHQLAPLCKGPIGSTVESDKVGEYRSIHQGEIIRCPWHRWEFHIKTGKSIFNPHKLKVKTYEVTVEDENGNPVSQCRSSDDPDPSVETYPVEVQAGYVVVMA